MEITHAAEIGQSLAQYNNLGAQNGCNCLSGLSSCFPLDIFVVRANHEWKSSLSAQTEAMRGKPRQMAEQRLFCGEIINELAKTWVTQLQLYNQRCFWIPGWHCIWINYNISPIWNMVSLLVPGRSPLRADRVQVPETRLFWDSYPYANHHFSDAVMLVFTSH